MRNVAVVDGARQIQRYRTIRYSLVSELVGIAAKARAEDQADLRRDVSERMLPDRGDRFLDAVIERIAHRITSMMRLCGTAGPVMEGEGSITKAFVIIARASATR